MEETLIIISKMVLNKEYNVKPWLPAGRRHIGTIMTPMPTESSSTIRDFPVPDELIILVDLE